MGHHERHETRPAERLRESRSPGGFEATVAVLTYGNRARRWDDGSALWITAPAPLHNSYDEGRRWRPHQMTGLSNRVMNEEVGFGHEGKPLTGQNESGHALQQAGVPCRKTAVGSTHRPIVRLPPHVVQDGIKFISLHARGSLSLCGSPAG